MTPEDLGATPNADLRAKLSAAYNRILELQRLEESSRRVAENEAASAKQWREELAKANLQNDEYRKALEEINKLPVGNSVETLLEIRFRAINISYKALRPMTEARDDRPPICGPCRESRCMDCVVHGDDPATCCCAADGH